MKPAEFFPACLLFLLLSVLLAITTAADVNASDEKHPSSQVETWERVLRVGNALCGAAIRQSTDGGFLVAAFVGYTKQPTDAAPTFLIKLTPSGEEEWHKSYERHVLSEVGLLGKKDLLPIWETVRSVELTEKGDVVIAGQQWVFAKRAKAGFIRKVDQTGNVRWIRTFEGPSKVFSMTRTQDHGFIIAAEILIIEERSYVREEGTYKIGVGSQLYLLKTGPNGDKEWDKRYCENRTIRGGLETAYSAIQTEDGGYVAVGSIGRDVFLLRTDRTGAKLWQKVYADKYDPTLHSVVEIKGGGFLMVGGIRNRNGISAIYVIAADKQGNQLWAKRIGHQEEETSLMANDMVGYQIKKAHDGNYVIVGGKYLRSYEAKWRPKLNAHLVKIDSEGRILWHRTYGGRKIHAGFSVEPTVDGGYAICGYSISENGEVWDIWIAKTDQEGNILKK